MHKIKIRHERCLIPARAPHLPRALATTWRQLGRGANTNGPHPTPHNPHPPCPPPFLFYFTTGASERRATWARSLNHTHTKAAMPFESSPSAVCGFVSYFLAFFFFCVALLTFFCICILCCALHFRLPMHFQIHTHTHQ